MQILYTCFFPRFGLRQPVAFRDDPVSDREEFFGDDPQGDPMVLVHMIGRHDFRNRLAQKVVPLGSILYVQPNFTVPFIDVSESFPVAFVAHDGPFRVAERIIFDDMRVFLAKGNKPIPDRNCFFHADLLSNSFDAISIIFNFPENGSHRIESIDIWMDNAIIDSVLCITVRKGGDILISREMMGAYIPMLHNQFKEQMNLLVGKIDLTTSQIHVLFYLKSRGDEEVIQKDIEETFNLTNPTVTGIIKRLEAKGFVTRTVSSKDARSKSIHLTEKSIAASEEMKRAMHEANKKVFEGFTEEELDVLEECFIRMLHNLEGGCSHQHGHGHGHVHKKENN